MKEIWNNFISSFNNSKDGGSARKSTAFGAMIFIAYCHYKFVSNTNVVEVIIIDWCGVLICLGLVTAQNIIELKNGGKDKLIE